MSEVNAKTNEVMASANPYPFVKSWMKFSWECSECKHWNIADYDNWAVYGGVEECVKCEKAHNVKEPWK